MKRSLLRHRPLLHHSVFLCVYVFFVSPRCRGRCPCPDVFAVKTTSTTARRRHDETKRGNTQTKRYKSDDTARVKVLLILIHFKYVANKLVTQNVKKF